MAFRIILNRVSIRIIDFSLTIWRDALRQNAQILSHFFFVDFKSYCSIKWQFDATIIYFIQYQQNNNNKNPTLLSHADTFSIGNVCRKRAHKFCLLDKELKDLYCLSLNLVLFSSWKKNKEIFPFFASVFSFLIYFLGKCSKFFFFFFNCCRYRCCYRCVQHKYILMQLRDRGIGRKEMNCLHFVMRQRILGKHIKLTHTNTQFQSGIKL